MKKLFIFLVIILVGLMGYYFISQVFLSEIDYSEAISSLENNTLVVGTDATYPPMESIADDGSYVGFDMDLIREIGRRFGVDVKIQHVNWEELFSEVESGGVDLAISSISITPKRAETMLFSNPYVNAGQVMIVSNNSSIESSEDLRGKRIAAQKGTTSEEEARKYSELILTYKNEYESKVDDLKAGDLDAIIIDFVAGVEIIKTNKTLLQVGDPLTSEFYGIATSLKNAQLIKGVNLVLSELKSDGTILELETKWFID